MDLNTNIKTGEVKISDTTVTQPVVTKEPDLVTRVSQFKKEESKVEDPKSDGQVKEPEFDFKDIDKIEDPKAKEYAEKAYKSFQRGFNQKFQEVADIRKRLEAKENENTVWTPERIQELLNDKNFVQAAQTVASSQAPSNFEGTQEEWSGLSDTDKVKFHQLEQKISILEQQNSQAKKIQEDEMLKAKFSNYKPEAVDILTADLLAGKVQATREHLWKLYDYDDALRRAYELGKQDRQTEVKEKVSLSSTDGITTTTAKEVQNPNKGENDRDFFKRLFLQNLAKSKDASLRK